MSEFNQIARRYEKESVVQKAAAELLLSLLEIGPREDILEVGCGTGHLAAHISQLTSGRVLGIDAASGMIAEAQSKYASERLSFELTSAEDLSVERDFDAIFCNSAMQWFHDPERALKACHRALRPGGRMGAQAPARHDYCPNFLEAIAEVAHHPATAATYSRFQSPWFFCETADAYAEVFRSAGFVVPFARIERTNARYTLEQVLKVFESGAAAGYLNPACYGGPLPDAYVRAFRDILAGAFRTQTACDGRIDLVFHRIYLVATRAGGVSLDRRT